MIRIALICALFFVAAVQGFARGNVDLGITTQQSLAEAAKQVLQAANDDSTTQCCDDEATERTEISFCKIDCKAVLAQVETGTMKSFVGHSLSDQLSAHSRKAPVDHKPPIT